MTPGPKWLSPEKGSDRAEEIEAHLDLLTEQLISQGIPPVAARRQARLSFGNPRAKLEAVEALSRIPWLDAVLRDLRHAAKSLRATPAFTAVAVSVLALGIAISTSMFSVVDAMMLRGLPFDRANRIVRIASDWKSTNAVASVPGPTSAPEFLAWRGLTDVFSSVAATASEQFNVKRTDGTGADVVPAMRVSAEFFSVLNTWPIRGRPLSVDDEVPGRNAVAVISYQFWQRHFGGAENVIGQWIHGDDADLQVVGVMPEHFVFPLQYRPAEFWRPYVAPAPERQGFFSFYLQILARLQDGVSPEAARARLQQATDVMISDLGAGSPATGPRVAEVSEFHDTLTGSTGPWMMLLFAATACVLLIACANVANLMLVRSTTRVRELGVRTALGATRWTVARHLLAEGLLVSWAATALGVLLAWQLTALLATALPDGVFHAVAIAVNVRVLIAAVLLSMAIGVAFALPPALQIRKLDTSATFKEDGLATTSSSRVNWLRSAFVITEVAVAVVLVAGGALFITSFARLTSVDLGFDYRNVVSVQVSPAGPGFAGKDAANRSSQALEAILERVRLLPGVERAAAADPRMPMSGAITTVAVTNRGGPGGVRIHQVSPGYFSTLGMSIIAGRDFSAADLDGREPVLIVNHAAAEALFGSTSPVGQQIGVVGNRTIVGVVNDARYMGPAGQIAPEVFVPLAQSPIKNGVVIVRTRGESGETVPAVKQAIWAELPGLAIPESQTLAQSLHGYLAQRQFQMLLLGFFGGLGLVIAGIGVYGLMAYSVAARRREFAIRVALGAAPSKIAMSVLQRSGLLLATGLVIGLAACWPLGSVVRAFLFATAPHEPDVYIAVSGILIAAALLASWVPARRASRADPLMTLKGG